MQIDDRTSQVNRSTSILPLLFDHWRPWVRCSVRKRNGRGRVTRGALLTERLDAAIVAVHLTCEGPLQFTRGCSRVLGLPQLRDIMYLWQGARAAANGKGSPPNKTTSMIDETRRGVIALQQSRLEILKWRQVLAKPWTILQGSATTSTAGTSRHLPPDRVFSSIHWQMHVSRAGRPSMDEGST